MIGRINSFHSFSTNDGPGIRAVVFMQGCPLRCKCCHNPETWDGNRGEEIDVDDLVLKVKRGLSYYQNGGVTCSGGEALLQATFVNEFFRKCHEELKLHTTLDTSGCVLNQEVKELLANTDLVLLDVKMTTEDKYKDFAKGSLKQTMEFLDYLEENKIRTWIRHVIIPTINYTKNEAIELKRLLGGYGCIEKIEFLPYRSLCTSKYEELNINFPYTGIRDATHRDIEIFETWFK